ncbi:hypothetical protein AAFC00_001170 [Neodothiora populina]|uniref:NAD(P)-binding protein n=1 Tax=Neodothiora populina TaxID=2781224 RepID=A0ABR3PN25_9PEZI
MNTSKPVDPSDLFSAKDLVIVITGGGSGIGLAYATALANSGASKVFLLSRRLEPLEAAAKAINPSIVHPIQCDVTSPDSIASAVKVVESQVSHVDVLINNAGIIGPDHNQVNKAQSIREVQQVLQSDWAKWDTTWQTNTSAVVGVSAAFLHLLDKGNKRRGWVQGKRETQKRDGSASYDAHDQRTSQIITVASIAAFNRKITAGLAYTASKAGAVMLGKSMSHFLAPWGIRSNIICPGRFPSDMTAGGATVFPVNEIPAGTQGEYEDMAGLILFMVGKSGAYHNGSVQVIDGGRLSVMPATY